MAVPASTSSTDHDQESPSSGRPGPSPQSASVFGQPVRSFLRELGREADPVLASIVEAAEQLRGEASEETELAAQIHEQGEELRWVLRSVGRLAALMETPAELEPEVVDAEDTVRALLDHFRASGRTEGLSLAVEVPAASVSLTTDADALRRALRPLLANAIAFTSDGEVTVQIGAVDEQVEFRVRDTGIGLPAEEPEALFAPFYQQIPEEADRPEGLGMGLPLARAFADCLGGTVEADGDLDEGCMFTLRVPQELPVAAEQGRPQVLVVEDNDITRRLLCRMLEEEYCVDVASGAREGIRKADEGAYDAFILDVNLKGRRTGIEVLHAVRRMEQYESVPAVACTAYGRDDHQDNFLQAGFNQVVAKPVPKRALLEALDRAFEHPAPTEVSKPVVSLSGIELPPLPTTLVTIAGLPLSDPDESDIETLTRTLEKDLVISQWVLHHINSAYYGMRKSVGTVERAVRYLGFRPVCNLVLTRVIGESFSDTDVPGAARVQQRVMRTSTMAAFMAREIADAFGLDNPSVAYTGGMFAQIGRLVLLESEGEAYVSLWYEEKDPQGAFLGPPPQGQEILHFGEDYVQNGIAVGKTCGLSGDVLSVLQGHTRPTMVRDPFRPLVPIVSLALEGAHLAMDAGGDEEEGRQLAERMRELRITQFLARQEAVAEKTLAAEVAAVAEKAQEFAGQLLD